MNEDDFNKIEGMLSRHIGAMAEDFQHKLDIVVEGQQMLAERMDRMEERLEKVENKIDRVEVKVAAVAADLSAHRADTEAHHGVYRVKES
ncbi:MAG: hypothetical protein NDI77_07675 [Geobacteraceae bacterium]|nr:hypothetical protein [Geobacteraceae bacterium]